MCRMLGVMCNDEDLLPCAVAQYGEALRCSGEGQHDGVGVGYYQLDDPLLIRRPSAALKDVDYRELLKNIKSKVVLAHVRRATVGAWKDSNTHPFRFRRWLFAHIGHLPGVESARQRILDQLPSFLARDIRGETDSELAFHMLLHLLFKQGRLNEDDISLPALEPVITEFVGLLNGLHEGQPRPQLAVIITNGQVLAAYNQGVPLHYAQCDGLLECPYHRDDKSQQEGHARFRGVFVAADLFRPGSHWREIPDTSLLYLGNQMELKIKQL